MLSLIHISNLTTIKNEVKSLVQEGYSIIAGDKQQSYTMAGYPIGYFYGYKVAGVYQSQADIDASPKNTLATVTPGDLKFADVNGDGEITPEDRTMIGTNKYSAICNKWPRSPSKSCTLSVEAHETIC